MKFVNCTCIDEDIPIFSKLYLFKIYHSPNGKNKHKTLLSLASTFSQNNSHILTHVYVARLSV